MPSKGLREEISNTMALVEFLPLAIVLAPLLILIALVKWAVG